MAKKKKQGGHRLDPNHLHFIPLGGSEQFGCNLNVYAYKDTLIAIDCGIGFADINLPLVDILLPDPAYLEKYKDKLAGLIITHAHEDHVGAVPHLWPRLKCPVYAAPFTAEVLKRKLSDHPKSKDMPIHIIKDGGSLELGPFVLEFMQITHSIPDMLSILVKTDQGNVVHSGDWMLDATPMVGDPYDLTQFKKAGDDGVLAYIGDSTNAHLEGRTISEAEVAKGMEAVIARQPARVAVTMFSSNIGRMISILRAAHAAGRYVVPVGRSILNMIGAARESGYFKDEPEFISEKEAKKFNKNQIVYIVTGSQGEARAALARISRGDHSVKLEKGDTVIFSSRDIPGNEKDILEIKNRLIAGNIAVITGKNHDSEIIHTSGHPRRGEIIEMWDAIRPKYVIPVHGERMMIEAQSDLARAQGIGTVTPQNGSVIRLSQEECTIVDHVPTDLLAVEPNRIVSVSNEAVQDRRKLQYSGVFIISLPFDEADQSVGDPVLSQIGLEVLESSFEDELFTQMAELIETCISKGDIYDLDTLADYIRREIRKSLNARYGFKPEVIIHIV